MLYRVIGLMSGSSLDGLDIAFVEFLETSGKWSFEVKNAETIPYDKDWIQQLQSAPDLSAKEYLLLHSRYGHYTGSLVNQFIDKHHLHYQVQLIASHGHTSFHMPGAGMTAQLGDGAAIAAETGIITISDLRAMDVALGGQGAPIVPISEKLLWPGHSLFLNIGGIANVSFSSSSGYKAMDICPANRVLNLLAAAEGLSYDAGGSLAASGTLHNDLLEALNALDYYKLPAPKSLANQFGIEIVLPLIKSFGLSTADALHTYCEHIAQQVLGSIRYFKGGENLADSMLVTGGGAFNDFLLQRLQSRLTEINTTVVVPDAETINFKEAIAMALIGTLRWRDEANVLQTVTGASKDSVGGAVWGV